MNSNEYRAILRAREKDSPFSRIQVESDGTLLPQDEEFLARYNSTNIFFEISQLSQRESMMKFLTAPLAKQVRAIEISGYMLSSQSEAIESLAEALFQDHATSPLPLLESVTLTHIPFHSHHYQHFYSRLVRWINPSSLLSGSGQWRRLRLYDCHFPSLRQLSDVIDAIRGNVILEDLELSLTHPALSDDCIAQLRNSLTRFESRLTSLSLCHHALTAAGLKEVVEIIRHPRTTIKRLNLSHSFSTPSEEVSGVLNDVVLAAMSTRQLTHLTLSHCHLADGGWSQFLSFTPSLHLLDLSGNLLDDNHVIAILRNLTHSFSLRELNLAKNRFHHHRIANSFTTLLQHNLSLHRIDVSFNRLALAVWSGISDGLRQNTAMLTLVCQSCDITWKEIDALSSFMQSNDVTDLSLAHNPLPADVIRNPRNYVAQHYSSAKTSSRKILPLAPLRERSAVEAAREWRTRQRHTIFLSLKSLHIVSSTSSREMEVEEDDWRCWRRDVIEQSEFFLSAEALHEELGDLDHLDSNESKEVAVCFGRSGYVIGHIDIKKRFTYHYVREEMLLPMVGEYCQSVSASDVSDFMNFSVVTMREEVIEVEAMKARKVWPDVYSEDQPFLLLKPATWLKLSTDS